MADLPILKSSPSFLTGRAAAIVEATPTAVPASSGDLPQVCVPFAYLTKTWRIKADGSRWREPLTDPIEYPEPSLCSPGEDGVKVSMHINHGFVHATYEGKVDSISTSPNSSGLKLRINLQSPEQAALAWDVLQGIFYHSRAVSKVKFSFSDRFRDNSQFTIYLYERRATRLFDLEGVQALIQNITRRLSEHGIRPGATAATDMAITDFVSARFDHTFSEWEFGCNYPPPYGIRGGGIFEYNYKMAFDLSPELDDIAVSPTELLLRTFCELLRTGEIACGKRRDALIIYQTENSEIQAQVEKCKTEYEETAATTALPEFSREVLDRANQFYQDELNPDIIRPVVAPVLLRW